jgi:hypothetical protein
MIAMAHAARQLVRVVVHAALRGRDANPAQHLDGLRAGGGLAELAMDHRRFRELRADPVERVQARHRVLEDHRHLGPAEPAHAAVGHADELLAVDPHLAGHLGRLAVEQAHDRERGDALARAGLADDRQRLAAGDGHRHALDGVDEAVFGRELDAEVVDGEIGRWCRRFGLALEVRLPHAMRTRGSMTA